MKTPSGLHGFTRLSELAVLAVIFFSLFDPNIGAPEGKDFRKSNFSFPSTDTSPLKGFVPSASLDDPVYASHPHHHPDIQHHGHLPDHHPEAPNHLRHHEHPPAPLDPKGPKKPREGKGFSLDKGPPELQLGISFTVPFMSLSTDNLVNSLTGKSFTDPYGDMSSLFKLNVGGLVVAAIVGIAALLFVPSILPGKFPGLFSGGGSSHGFLPTFIDQFMPGLVNKPFSYGSYDHPYDPYPSDYAKSDGAYDGRGRALKRGANVTATAYSEIFSTVRNAINTYWGEMESCAFHAMCLRGKHASEEKRKKTETPNSNSGKAGGGGGGHRHSRRPDDSPEDEESLSSFEHILEAIHGMQGITKSMPIFHELHKAYKAGQDGRSCTEEYKACPVTPDGISKAINNMGNYIFNNNN